MRIFQLPAWILERRIFLNPFLPARNSIGCRSTTRLSITHNSLVITAEMAGAFECPIRANSRKSFPAFRFHANGKSRRLVCLPEGREAVNGEHLLRGRNE